MLRLDFLYRALTTLIAYLPAFLTPEPRSESPAAARHILDTPATSHHTPEPSTADTAPSRPPHPQPSEAPLRTSRKRVDSMNSAKRHNNDVQVVQEVPSAKDGGVLNHNTGFPEPLNPDRNTTLPHPSADTSKDATLEAEDVALARTHSKSRFLHSRHRGHRSVSGKIVPEERPKDLPGGEKIMDEGIADADGGKENGGAAAGVVNAEAKKEAEKNGRR